MSNPTEQPIDPERMTIRCEICKEEIIGYMEWDIYLDSKYHKSKLANNNQYSKM